MHALARALHDAVPDARRVEDYYAPLALWCEACLEARPRRPWVLGIQGPQGGGKSTLAAALVRAFGEVGARGVAVSIDDFYLTHDEQRALAARHPGNPCLQYRGYPGTHEVDLGTRVIDELVALGPGAEARVPVYDKSAHGGRGDRAPREAWRPVTGPLDLLIVEGWMLGFSPVDEASLPPDLRAPNALLAPYAAWHRRLDAFVSLQVSPIETVVRWRVDAERARRAQGETALGDEDARDYIERFVPAYHAYLPALTAHPPCTDHRIIHLGEDRQPRRP